MKNNTIKELRPADAEKSWKKKSLFSKPIRRCTESGRLARGRRMDREFMFAGDYRRREEKLRSGGGGQRVGPNKTPPCGLTKKTPPKKKPKTPTRCGFAEKVSAKGDSLRNRKRGRRARARGQGISEQRQGGVRGQGGHPQGKKKTTKHPPGGGGGGGGGGGTQTKKPPQEKNAGSRDSVMKDPGLGGKNRLALRKKGPPKRAPELVALRRPAAWR